MAEKKKSIPVTILTGFLGAGKTTLLNHLMHGEHGLRVAVMVNDFGAVNIDSQLIVGVKDEDTVNLSNGCICCTIRGDLLNAAVQLANRPDRPDFLIVEASGVADPVGIVTTFASELARGHFLLDSVLTVVDAEQALEHILSREATRKKFGAKIEDILYTFFPSKQADLYENQIRTADLVVLNKTDLLDADSLNAVRDWLHDIHSNARRFETTFGRIPLELAIGVGRFDPAQIKSEARDVHVHEAGAESDHDHHHEHDHSLIFETWSFTNSKPFDLKKLRQALITLPPSIYRAKGAVYLVDYPEKRDVLHVVGRRIRLMVGDAWAENESKRSQIVMIGSHGGVDAAELESRFTSALAVDSTPQTESKSLASLLEWLRTGISSS
jgi:G3E family GTPase